MILFLIFWAVCGALCYGWCFAFFQREYPLIAKDEYSSHRQLSMFVAVAGPLGALALFAVIGRPKHGLKFW